MALSDLLCRAPEAGHVGAVGGPADVADLELEIAAVVLFAVEN